MGQSSRNSRRNPRWGKVNDWSSLCKFCGIEGEFVGTAHSILIEHIESLADAELIHVDGGGSRDYGRELMDARFQATDGVEKLQRALDVSLKEVAQLDRHSSMVVNPLFGRPDEKRQNVDLFVLMPFAPAFQPVYEDHVKKVAADLALSVARADDFFTNNSIVDDIWRALNSARLVIADCSDRNPNVFYEIGLAHVVGKPVILLTQDKKDVPFDLLHLRHLEYKYTPRGMAQMEHKLTEAIGALLETDD